MATRKRQSAPKGRRNQPRHEPEPVRGPRKPIADMIGELRSWLPNYDHGPTDYPTLVWRLLASAPGGDQAEDMGYETFNISWHEIDQLGRMLEAIQDKQDVEDLVAGLMSDEDPEDLEEAPRGRVRSPIGALAARRGR